MVDAASHLTDADIVFNSEIFSTRFGTSLEYCLRDGNAIDVQRNALHEFGHWGFLDHSTWPGSIMIGSSPSNADERCQRTLGSQDVLAMGQLQGALSLDPPTERV